GKLKADDWRTLGTTVLPVTLVQQWSSSSDNLHQKLLEMTMSLVSAIIIATSHSTSKANAELYTVHMKRYLQLMKELYPDEARVIMHAAIHIPEFLMMFGPAHGWWTYPFERLIGMLQNISTNYIPGM
ncbi:hypothetical protein C8J56DRAFT_802162, partial [Mycena floridula]